MVSVADLISYPEIYNIKDVPEIKGQYVYMVSPYVEDGVSLLYDNSDGELKIRFGDWDGNVIDPTNIKYKYNKIISNFIANEGFGKLLATIKMTGIKLIQLYFVIENNEMVLVDVRKAQNAFCGPGMINDVFGRIVKTQTLIDKPIYMSDEMMESVKTKSGLFKRPMILKPSAFKTIIRGRNIHPLYARIS